jgi:hypothetical protein
MEFSPEVLTDLIYLAAGLLAAVFCGSSASILVFKAWLDKKTDRVEPIIEGLKPLFEQYIQSQEPGGPMELKFRCQCVANSYGGISLVGDAHPGCEDCGGSGWVARDKSKGGD